MEYLESGSNITGLTGTPSTTGGRTNVKWVIDELPNGAKALVCAVEANPARSLCAFADDVGQWHASR